MNRISAIKRTSLRWAQPKGHKSTHAYLAIIPDSGESGLLWSLLIFSEPTRIFRPKTRLSEFFSSDLQLLPFWSFGPATGRYGVSHGVTVDARSKGDEFRILNWEFRIGLIGGPFEKPFRQDLQDWYSNNRTTDSHRFTQILSFVSLIRAIRAICGYLLYFWNFTCNPTCFVI